MRVLFVSHNGSGFADFIEVDEGTSIKEFVANMVPGKARDYTIKVNRQIIGSEYFLQENDKEFVDNIEVRILQENDRVSVSPKNVIGAYHCALNYADFYAILSSPDSTDPGIDFEDDDTTDPDCEELSLADLTFLTLMQ